MENWWWGGGGGRGHAKFFRDNQKTTGPPLPIKNERSLTCPRACLHFIG